jgi:uncharacterized tellurite resistance protein B-like protein
MDFKKLFGVDSRSEAESLGRLFDQMQEILSSHSQEEIRRISGVAGLLGYVAYADMEISEIEISHIKSALRDFLHLSDEQCDPILDLLQNHRVDLFSLEDHTYYRLINGESSESDKRDILRVLFSVVAADHTITAEENTTMRLVANGLLLSHHDFVSIRKEFKQFRELFKD